ncbi:transcriptional regulator, LysR family [Alkaliphilus metalliredigens QYMF]|uniref:Transcriptional regulator, LysR family n=1 Tax=Alkaliphilus metalliredigens (strain QYMF) TaxID=293826 RepID=A6TSV9_ALKMQ|nr:selenium metabolism-associated LysR family transcriptional regulator [Alkaliphilus metalliredigens]ABR49277.1 transcriptional regulator, LysR family [Alkaliphilus metalliredigens QYMF]
MDFRQLESFIAISKFKSFSKAADSLYLTQPTISSHIANLETELNTILIDRSNKKISLTKAGIILFDYALNMINIRDIAKFKLGEFKGKIVGNIELASSTIPEQYIIPELISVFHDSYPDVTFSVRHYDSAQVVEGILKGEIDFGMVGAKLPNNQLHYIELLTDEVVLAMPYDHPYGDPSIPLDLKKLLEENFIFREKGSGTRALLEQGLNQFKLDTSDLKIVAYIENTEAIKQCIRRGLGLSFLSKKAVKDEVAHGLLRARAIPELKLHRNFYFVYHKHRSPSPLEIEFQKFVCQYYNKT